MTLLLTLNRPQTPQLATISTPALSSAPKKPGGNAARDRAIKAQKAQEKRSAAATAAKPGVANHGPYAVQFQVITNSLVDPPYQ